MSCVQAGGHQIRDITKRYKSLTEQGQGLPTDQRDVEDPARPSHYVPATESEKI